MKILVGHNDSPIDRKTGEQIAELGHSVIFCTGIDNIPDSVVANKPDIVLLPLDTGQENNFLMTRIIQDAFPVPVIILTSQISDAEFKEAVSSGVSWLLQVPAETAAMKDAITMALLRHQDFIKLKTAEKRIDSIVRASLHRMKNDMATITSLMRLQAACYNRGETETALLESAERVRVIASLYNFINSPDLEDTVRLDQFLELIVNDLLLGISEEDGYSIDYSMDKIFTNIPVAQNCGLIVYELVANAVKHAFAGDVGVKKIHVAVRMEPVTGSITINVMDNGIGLPAAIDPDKATSFGLQLVTFLVNQLKGSLQLLRSGGTAITINFKPPRLGTGLSEK